MSLEFWIQFHRWQKSSLKNLKIINAKSQIVWDRGGGRSGCCFCQEKELVRNGGPARELQAVW